MRYQTKLFCKLTMVVEEVLCYLRQVSYHNDCVRIALYGEETTAQMLERISQLQTLRAVHESQSRHFQTQNHQPSARFVDSAARLTYPPQVKTSPIRHNLQIAIRGLKPHTERWAKLWDDRVNLFDDHYIFWDHVCD